MLPLLRSELFRLRHRWMTWVLLLVVVLGVAGVYAILWATYAAQDASDIDDIGDDLRFVAVPDIGLDIAYFFASIVAVILGASIVGTEYGWGTLRALLPRARSRISLLGAKLVALVLFDVALLVVGFVTAFAMSALVGSAEGLNDGLGAGFWGDALLAIGRNIYILLPYSALAFMVATVTRSNAAGIAIGLAILLAEGIVVSILNALGNTFDWVGDVLFTNNIAAISNLNNSGDGGRSDLPAAGQAVVVLGLWTIALVAVALAVFRRRDVTSG